MYEKEAINLYQKLISEAEIGDWEHSPVENWKPDYFRENLTEENLKHFRANKLSAGLKADMIGQTAFYKDDLAKKHFNSVLEIGAGFGELAYFIGKQYYIVDLPENLALAYYYLKEKGMKVHVFEGEVKDGVNIVAPWRLKDLNAKIDLFINTMSFQHMTHENIVFYLKEVDRLKIPLLYLVNRDFKRDETDVKMSDYPIPKDYKLIKSKKYPYSDHLINVYELPISKKT